MTSVLVLGAGFSRAVSNAMPLTDELGEEIRARIPEARARSPRGFTGGYFEAWLSRLAEPQPDLPDHVNQTNYGLFLQISQEMRRVMLERELQVLEGAPPWWLFRLIGLMHVARANVITFNYDTLVERTVENLTLGDWHESGRAKAINVVRNLPPIIRRGWFTEPQIETLRLLKLHGSLDTFWVSGDTSGATINRHTLPGGWGNPQALDETTLRNSLPGRTPFIVPPAAAKSAFYNNPVSRELWRSAAEAIASADRIALIGYSLPPTDLVTSGMLADAIADREVAFDIVNPYPDPVVEHLRKLGVPDSRLTKVASATAFVDNEEQAAGLEVLHSLRVADGQRLLMVGQSTSRAARVTGIRRDTDGIYVEITDICSCEQASQVPNSGSAETVSVADLTKELLPSEVIKVRFKTGETATIVGLGFYNASVGLGDGKWSVLVPAAIPAS